MRRVTIDLDEPSDIELLKTYYNMNHLFGNVKCRRSSTKGFHLISFADEELSEEEVIDIRESIGDDPNRVRWDRLRSNEYLDRHVLWSEKGDNSVGEFISNFKKFDSMFPIEV